MLSENRVQSVIDYLRKDIRNPWQVYGKGQGEEQLVNHCRENVECTEEEHKRNRRAEFKIVLEPYLPTVYHDFDDAKVQSDKYKRLDYIIEYMNSNPGIKVELSSHTDSWGDPDYNMHLSQRRAEEVLNYMRERLNNPNQISGRGYGDTRLANECTKDVQCTTEQHEQNRRTEFKIVK